MGSRFGTWAFLLGGPGALSRWAIASVGRERTVRGRSSFPGEAGLGLRPFGLYPLVTGRGLWLGAEFAEAFEGLRGPRKPRRAEFASLRQSLSVEIPCAVDRVPGSGKGRSFSC